jgi:uroporphyrinogen-III decarboxylase
MLRAMASSGADVLELDHFVDLADACRFAGPEITIWGNLDPVGVLARGTPAEVEAAARKALAAVNATGHRRFVLSSGCTLAVETPPANLDALNRVARASRFTE